MYSSRMCTARLLTVSGGVSIQGGLHPGGLRRGGSASREMGSTWGGALDPSGVCIWGGADPPRE